MSRIVQVANFVAPSSGGLRTALNQLAEGYSAHHHDVVQVIPGPADTETAMPWGTRMTLRAPAIPGTGYRMFSGADAVAPTLARFRPYRLEVHDRTTLRGLGRWAARRQVRSLVVSHERLDRLLGQWLPTALPLVRAADRSNRTLAAAFDTVVCTTGWAAEEFARLGTPNLRCVPLGVDLSRFHPDQAMPGRPGEPLLVMAGRLSKEKRPGLAIDAVRELARRGRHVRLVVAGDGPLRGRLGSQALGLPVEFLGFVAEPSRLAALLATADVVIAPGPVETFGLAALEALASGTPVVANAASALPEVLGAAGRAAAGTPAAFADAIEALLDGPRAEQRRTARVRAEHFPWTTTVSGFLAAHGIAATNDRRHHEPAAGRERTPEGGRPRRQPQLR